MSPSVNTLYSSGQKHNAHTPKNTTAKRSAKESALVTAVMRIMRSELSDSACRRWIAHIDSEVGRPVFGVVCEHKTRVHAESDPTLVVPSTWSPTKPKIALALLDVLASPVVDGPSPAPRTTIGEDGPLTKTVARHTIDRMREAKGEEWLRSCGELTSDQLESPNRVTYVISRVAFDLFVYLHARAVELRRELQADTAVLVLQGAFQTLHGRELRGCGIVHGGKGRELFAQTATSVRDKLACALAVNAC